MKREPPADIDEYVSRFPPAVRKRLEQIRRPRSERDHGLIGIERAFFGVDAPVLAVSMQRAGVAMQQHTAQRLKARHISPRQTDRRGNARGLRPEHAAPEHRIERRLDRARLLGIEHVEPHAELLRHVPLARQPVEGLFLAVDLEPAGLAQVARAA